jgi:hypothetical protein
MGKQYTKSVMIFVAYIQVFEQSYVRSVQSCNLFWSHHHYINIAYN